MKTAVEWLKAAIARHQRHMDGKEATSEESQMKMMEEMKAALAALESMEMKRARGGLVHFGAFPKFAQRADAKADAKGLAWNKLFPAGTHHRWDFPDGKVVVDAAFASKIVANWEAMGRNPIPVDYFHRGDSNSHDGLSVDQKKAAGWIEALEVREGEVWGGFKWTSAAKALIDADELRFLSPTWWWDYTNPKSGEKQGPTLVAAALLNDPFFTELPKVAAAQNPGAQNAPSKERQTMDRKLLCATLKLKEDATDAEITAAINQRDEDLAKANASIEDLRGKVKASSETKDAEVKALATRLDASTKENENLSKRLEKIENETAEKERKALATRFVREGRIAAAQAVDVEEYAKNNGLEKAKAFFEKFPVNAMKGEVGLDVVDEGTETPADAQVKIAAMVADFEKKGMSGTQAERAAAKKAPALYALANKNLNAKA